MPMLLFIILNKIRHGDHDVEISIPNVDRYKEHIPILVDDIISTGRTMIETITHLKNAGMNPYLHYVHAVFAKNAYQESGARKTQ
jgi:ribose-phosphate pyrophosphokinase